MENSTLSQPKIQQFDHFRRINRLKQSQILLLRQGIEPRFPTTISTTIMPVNMKQ
jgi:hypothetical protein